jgi:putative redox protein
MAIRQKTTVTLEASASCPSHSLAKIRIRDLEFPIDEPTARGGTNLGPTPTDTAIAALVGCTNVIGHKCAQALNIDIGQLTIEARCDFDRRGVTLAEEIDVPFQKIVLNITCSGTAIESELAVLASEVAKFCPLSKLFRQAGTQIEEHWRLG